MSKEVTSGYNFEGDFNIILNAVKNTIEKMNLKNNNEIISDNMFHFEVTEKMKWLTTNWPVKFNIDFKYDNGGGTLFVRSSSTLVSITQDFNNKAKIEEFMDLVKVFAPTESKEINKTFDIERIPCPRCGEMIAKNAIMCRFCNLEL